MRRLKAFWQLISNFGCHPGLEPSELKRVRLTNQSSWVSALMIASYAPVFGLYGRAPWGWMTLGDALLFSAIPYLQKITRGALRVRYLFVCLGNANIFIYSILLGRECGMHLFFIAATAVPCIVMEVKHLKSVLALCLLPILLLLSLELVIFDVTAPLNFSVSARRLIYLMVLPSAALITFLFSSYFSLLNLRSEEALRHTIQNLHHSQKLIEDQQLQLATASRLSAIGELSGNIAHEISNPLAILLGYTEVTMRLLRMELVDRERILHYCERTLATINRITKIVQGLRKLSREGSDDPLEDADLKDVVEDTLSICSESLNQAGVELRVIAPDQRCSCPCRPLQIAQVLLNLIHNAKDAVQALEDRWIEIEIKLEPDHFVILVRDSGMIKDLKILDRIGQPFFTTKPPGKGTGLGLSISRRILAAHGGSIELDKGASCTTFVMQLPRQQEVS
ncbi:sensor histidine kinase [Oligoflexus tunisiensis]|uniref:sensor histidine kinase n=1 Tax=Oligoflexus tunisiensis TaxID=708132 RepID=UPI00114D38B1|nr:ATP-binding protein [Oligoflexus tunisiensis]